MGQARLVRQRGARTYFSVRVAAMLGPEPLPGAITAAAERRTIWQPGKLACHAAFWRRANQTAVSRLLARSRFEIPEKLRLFPELRICRFEKKRRRSLPFQMVARRSRSDSLAKAPSTGRFLCDLRVLCESVRRFPFVHGKAKTLSVSVAMMATYSLPFLPW
jgi:hypothetical protein